MEQEASLLCSQEPATVIRVILIHFNIIFRYEIVYFLSSLTFMISSHNPVSIYFLSMCSTFLAHLILLGLIILIIIFDEEDKS